jgi:predicted transcriptional regulator
MDIKSYLAKHDLNMSEFARLLGVHQSTVSRYLSGRCPSLKEALNIVKKTNGAITLKDLGYESASIYKKVKPTDKSEEGQKDGGESGNGN